LNIPGFNNSLFDRQLADFCEVDAAAVIADFDHHLRALVIRVQIHRATGRFSRGDALLSILYAVVYSVAYHVHQRLSQSVQDAFVEISVLPGKFERDIFAALLGDIANQTWKAAEELLDRHHANFQYAFVQLIEDARLKRQRVGQLGAHGITRMALVKFRQAAIQHGLPDDQLSHQVHDCIDARGIHPQSALREGSGGRDHRRRLLLRGACTHFTSLGGKIRGLFFQ